MNVPAKFENGVFRPLQDVQLKEGTVVEVHIPQPPPALKHPVRDTAFAGMWKDRDDLGDSVEYINRLRRDLHG